MKAGKVVCRRASANQPDGVSGDVCGSRDLEGARGKHVTIDRAGARAALFLVNVKGVKASMKGARKSAGAIRESLFQKEKGVKVNFCALHAPFFAGVY